MKIMLNGKILVSSSFTKAKSAVLSDKNSLLKIHDNLWERANHIFKKNDVCEIVDGMCYQGRLNGNNFCCGGCQYLSDTGCTVKSLRCKLWLCGEVHRKIHGDDSLHDFRVEVQTIKNLMHWFYLDSYTIRQSQEIEVKNAWPYVERNILGKVRK